MSGERREPHLLLAMDTSGDICSVAILRDGQFVAEYTFRHGMHLSERLMAHVDAVLHEADAKLSEVNAFAVGLGPGSFTGTRIGVMTIKTFAAVEQKPIVGIGSLEALVAEYTGLQGLLVVPLLPCRKGVVYAGVYDVSNLSPLSLIPPGAFSLDALSTALSALPPSGLLLCGAASETAGAELAERLGDVAPSVSRGNVLTPRASRVAQLAHRRFQKEPDGEDVLSLVPFYISPPQITLPKQEIPQPEAK